MTPKLRLNNNTGKKQDQCIHQVFELQAEQTPDVVAVVFPAACPASPLDENQHLTYRALDRCANQVARRLQALGVGPETRIGLCVERSWELIVGLLGILKAGAAYLPLDPAYPQERLAFMLADAQATVLLTQRKFLALLPPQETAVICLDAAWATLSPASVERPESPVRPDNLAYVFYTSGSTGVPKGVAIEHHSVLALLHAFEHVAPAPNNLTGTSLCSFGFDVSVWEFFSTLCFGGTLHLLLPEIFADAQRLARYLVERYVTSAYVPPALLPGVADALEKQGKLALQRLLLGVEPIKQGLLQRFCNLGDQMQVVNGYGPTETTICATFFDFKAASDPQRRTPIGTAARGYEVYVVDQKLRPVPVGVRGEILIGGVGLGRGYLGQAALNAEKFIPDPFACPRSPSQAEGRPGARLYRSGDLARYLPDGNVEFLGRMDHQTKIRGYRIELGEIEATLNQHPAVRQTVVIPWEDEPAEKQLVAYLVPNQKQAPAVSELYDFLKQKLPAYMIPSAFIMLEALPLTPNGKLDRRALPSPKSTRPELGVSFVAPRTPTQELLADIWAQALGLEQVGIYDDFFALGGYSLLATQMVSRICNVLQVELAAQALFVAPTVAGLAARIKAQALVEREQSPASITPVSRHSALALSFAQQQLWLVDQGEPGNIAYNAPFLLRLTGPLDPGVLHTCLEEIVRRHEVLRTTFATVEGEPIQVIAPLLDLSVPVIDLSHWPESRRENQALDLIRRQARRPFDLTKGPLVRAMLLKLAQNEHLLLLTMHHIVVDGWSLVVLLDELEALYTAFAGGETSPLAELPVQYADFSAWQREQLQGEKLAQLLDYWKQQLKDAPAALDLPTDRPRPALQTFRGANQTLALPPTLSETVEAFSRKAATTPFMTLLAAFNVLLYAYSGQTDIVVGSPSANRHPPQVERLVGYFVNPLALRTSLADHLTFRELLQSVRKTALDAYIHQELPFEKLVKVLQPRRKPGRNPLFQVMFAFEGSPAKPRVLPGLNVIPVKVDVGISHFDLSLVMERTARGIEGFLEYNTDLFDGGTIVQMAQNYQTLLQSVITNPDQDLATLMTQIKIERRGKAMSRPQRETVAPDTKQSIASQRAKLSERRDKLPAAERAMLEHYLGLEE